MLRYKGLHKRSQTNRADLCISLLQTQHRERYQSAGMTFTCLRDAQNARVRPLQHAHSASRRRTSTVEYDTCLQYLYRRLTLKRSTSLIVPRSSLSQPRDLDTDLGGFARYLALEICHPLRYPYRLQLRFHPAVCCQRPRHFFQAKPCTAKASLITCPSVSVQS